MIAEGLARTTLSAVESRRRVAGGFRAPAGEGTACKDRPPPPRVPQTPWLGEAAGPAAGAPPPPCQPPQPVQSCWLLRAPLPPVPPAAVSRQWGGCAGRATKRAARDRAMGMAPAHCPCPGPVSMQRRGAGGIAVPRAQQHATPRSAAPRELEHPARPAPNPPSTPAQNHPEDLELGGELGFFPGNLVREMFIGRQPACIPLNERGASNDRENAGSHGRAQPNPGRQAKPAGKRGACRRRTMLSRGQQTPPPPACAISAAPCCQRRALQRDG